jgi:hypothetical protein
MIKIGLTGIMWEDMNGLDSSGLGQGSVSRENLLFINRSFSQICCAN